MLMRLPVVGKAHEAGAAETGFGWFIYGSSLDGDAFAGWCKEHGYVCPDLASAIPVRLSGYALSFDVLSRFWGGAVASLRPEPGAAVEGVLLRLPKEAKGLVEHKEGVISGLYEPLAVRVTPLDGSGPEEAALAYVSSPARRLPAPTTPSERFVRTLLAGAERRGLSPAYRESLHALLPSS